ncbi:HemK2/MTQ2 family protein methyltransferase [Methanimicrococcus blatticola]|uniref:Release factor glutamine methyltransferase n=1 Tax=Methanimicrococcus blatticola TaxID=91560 RepID=A0A484F4J4_9EURY|nr:HemK2/MTQ2 family protein methyltransferase [Methanimicrococcus blatticola]MBZ3935500.1 methyltransferase [Methanimicrococcus blatticola]MCC2509143.1 methyltransferase [Methanimicrococcus blatticola]TDQ69491.1 release factor glutamine methyltransferase [Methanimicrococcus blatticola]
MTQNTAACQPVIVTKTEYKGTKVVVLEDVYEPAEDTFLMAECAVSEFSKFQTVNKSNVVGRESSDKLNENGNENFVLEVGCGSGFVSAFLQNNIPDLHLTAVDINPAAVLCAQMNGVRAIESDMFEIFEKQPLGFDMILFNPPYLPTSDDEKVSGMLNYAFDGGISGRDSIDRFLSEVGAYLKDGGFFLLLISSITGLDEVTAEMKKNGFFAEVVGTDKVSFEELIVLKGKRL